MKKVLIGCGVLAALVVVGGIVTSIIAVNVLKNSLPDTDQLEEQHEELIAAYGAPEDYTPSLSGRIDPYRVDVFLDVREAVAPHGETFVTALKKMASLEGDLENAGAWEKIKRVAGATGDGLALARGALGFMGTRDSLLLVNEMGIGEFSYLFAVTTVCDLQWDPLESIAAPSDQGRDIRRQYDDARDELRGMYRRQLDNQLRALHAESQLTSEQAEYLEVLQTALNTAGFPFEGSLPPYVEEVLIPRRDRLRATLPTDWEHLVLEALLLREDDDSDGFSVSFED